MASLRALSSASVMALAAVALVGVAAQPAVAAPPPPSTYSIGASALATPSGAGSYIYVATTGTNSLNVSGHTPVPNDRVTCLKTRQIPTYATSCPPADAQHPLATIQGGINAANPGDVIVVTAGTYSEELSTSAAAKGTATLPIVLQADPQAVVNVVGRLNLSSADYWTVDGFRFSWGSKTAQGQVVGIYGGTGWRFIHNIVQGTHGAANLLVRTDPALSGAAAAPQNYIVSSNCLVNPWTSDAAGTDHNLYLEPSTLSSGGLVSHNLMAGATNGGNIKAAGATSDLSPKNVQITYNTLLSAASGIILGGDDTNVVVDHNVIGAPANSGSADGGVKTYSMTNPTSNTVDDNVISGYANPMRETTNPTVHIVTHDNVPWNPLSYIGSTANCNVVLADNVASRFGAQGDPNAVLTPSVTRLAGADRYATSATISSTFFSPGVPVAYIATGLGYADALSAGPAAAIGHGPLLLTDPGALPAPIKTELQRLRPQKIVIVGGTAAVSAGVETALDSIVGASDVSRIAGTNRYDTSIRLAQAAFPHGADVAYLANGTNFPDALAAGPAAAHLNGPVLLVPGASSSVSSATLNELTALTPTTVKIAGGTSAVSSGIQTQVAGHFTVQRFAGADRFGTADLINADAFSGTVAHAYIATGYNFADALSGSARAGADGAPLYVAQPDCVPQAALDQFAANDTVTAYPLGGTAALSAGAANLFSCSAPVTG